MKIHILHTNDLHSYFENMPKIAGCIKALKREYSERGEPVLIMDIGDHMDRMRMKTEATFGQANIEIMNETGYQFACMGNNEGLTFPKDVVEHLYDSANFKVITANFHDMESGQRPKWLHASVIEQVGDIRIGMLGVTAPFQTFYRLMGWEVGEPFAVIRRCLDELRPKSDVVILLSHLGYPKDMEIAARFPEIDLILGAHTHHFLPEGEKHHSTFIAQTGKLGRYVGHVELTFAGGMLSGMKAECKEVQGFAEDPAITRLIANHKEKAIRLLSEPVGELEQRLSVSWKEESPFGNLLAEAIRKWTGADLALVNSGLLLSDLHPGAVTKKDLLEILPHPINPCTVKMKGTDIIRILEASLDPDMIDKKLIGFGFRGYVHGWVCVDNIEIHYDPSTERGSQIKKVLHNGRPLSENEYYVVATTDMYTFGHIFPQFQRAEDVRFFVPEFIREVMQKELADLAVRPQQIKKWWVNT